VFERLANWLISSTLLDLMQAILSAGGLLIAGAAVAEFLRRYLLNPTPTAFRVAVIGLPRSGKTSLIASIFSFIFRNRINRSITVSGAQTIDNVNRAVALLEAGLSVGPTREGDTFVYRFRLQGTPVFSFIPRRYDVEIADFPGEYSEKLFDDSRESSAQRESSMYLFNKEYYSWLLSSQVFYFVIDVGAVLCSVDVASFAANLKARIRASWQVLEETWSERGYDPRLRRVFIVFTKADVALLAPEGLALGPGDAKADIFELAFKSPKRLDHFDMAQMHQRMRAVEAEFEDLVRYFESKRVYARTFFTSAYAFDGGERYGIEELLRFTLPGGGRRFL
jgi:hypothetical protein